MTYTVRTITTGHDGKREIIAQSESGEKLNLTGFAELDGMKPGDSVNADFGAFNVRPGRPGEVLNFGPVPPIVESLSKRATWRNTGPGVFAGMVGFGLTLEGGEVVRFLIDTESARHLYETLAEALKAKPVYSVETCDECGDHFASGPHHSGACSGCDL